MSIDILIFSISRTASNSKVLFAIQTESQHKQIRGNWNHDHSTLQPRILVDSSGSSREHSYKPINNLLIRKQNKTKKMALICRLQHLFQIEKKNQIFDVSASKKFFWKISKWSLIIIIREAFHSIASIRLISILVLEWMIDYYTHSLPSHP